MGLGPSEYALRLFPFIWSLVAVVAFWCLAMRMLSEVGALVATLLFARAAPLVVYGGIVKHYLTDVAVAVLLCWLAYALTLAAVGPANGDRKPSME